MGKKNRGRNKRRRRQKKRQPFVSICTPTFNRRPFFPFTIKCFLHQQYPQDRMEWIIIDDGTDLIEDLIPESPNIHYFKYDQKMTLGKKRNLMHEKSKGDIIVYMDDELKIRKLYAQVQVKFIYGLRNFKKCINLDHMVRNILLLEHLHLNVNY